MKNEGVLFFICFELHFLFFYSLLNGLPTIYTLCFVLVFISLELFFLSFQIVLSFDCCLTFMVFDFLVDILF